MYIKFLPTKFLLYNTLLEMRRSSADTEVRPKHPPNVRLGNMWIFSRSSTELRQTFGVICGFTSAPFCARH